MRRRRKRMIYGAGRGGWGPLVGPRVQRGAPRVQRGAWTIRLDAVSDWRIMCALDSRGARFTCGAAFRTQQQIDGARHRAGKLRNT